MKLLYVWIEKFRKIEQQGFVVDDKYFITVDALDTADSCYFDRENSRVVFSENPSKSYSKIYRRKLNIEKNEQYIGKHRDLPIESITALVGENASGKTSIIECLHMRTDQFNYRNEDQRYFFLVFLDEVNNAIVVRSRDIWLIGEDTRRRDLRNNNGYEEYILPLTENADITNIISGDITNIISVYQRRRQETEWVYSVMGLPTIPINLDKSNSQNAFVGVFDFLCAFPKLGGEDNSLVIYLCDEDSREKAKYFLKEDLTYGGYKSYFIYKLANLLFGKLRDFLYHEKPQFVLSGERIKRPEEEILIKEDMECAEVLSFCCFDFPRSDSISMSSTHRDSQPKEHIAETISFFRKSTYVYNVKPIYDYYLDALEKLFDCLYDVDAELFTAFYKLEIPFREEFRNIGVAFSNCLASDKIDKDWCECIIVDFEWFSTGEYQQAIMFSGLYQRLLQQSDGFENRDLILLFDEPEMHMHPENGRRFIENLEIALTALKVRGLINYCQIIFATHSPFIIQELSNHSNSIALVKKGNGQITIHDFADLSQLILPNRTSYSFNLVMYKIFGVPTIELHNELYGVIQEVNKRFTNNAIEAWFEQSKLHIQKTKQWIEELKGSAQPAKDVTLQTYIRNSIHHPENRQNVDFSKLELQQSIEQMINLL